MTITYTDLNRVMAKYNDLNGAIANANASLQNVLRLGGILVADAAYAQTFGAVSGFPAWVTAAGSSITTFTGSFPAQPTIVFNL